MARILRLTEDEPITWKADTAYLYLGCCDCGLVHQFDLRRLAGGYCSLQARRDNRRTARNRRARTPSLFSKDPKYQLVKRRSPRKKRAKS